MLRNCCKVWCLILALIGWWVAPPVAAQRPRGLAISQTVQIPAAGLGLQVMYGAEPVGLSQPQVWHYRQPDGTITERFDPRDLWYPSVQLGHWQDAHGTDLIIGQLGPPMPTTFPIPHVSRDEYQVAVDTANLTAPATPAELVDWLEQFAEATPQVPPRTVSSGPRVAQVLAFDFEDADRLRRAYVFRFRANVHGVDPDQWFVALFQFERGIQLVPANIDRDFVSSLHTVMRPPVQVRSGHDHEARSADELDLPTAAHAEHVERALNSIRGLPGWWHEVTDHYVIVSDVSRGRRSFIDRLKADLEVLRERAAALIPPRTDHRMISLVRVFADPVDYDRYVGPEHANTAGLWMPGRRELVVRPPPHQREREQLDGLLRVVYHEAFHQYLHYAFDLIPTSPWYNEGHATFFEGAEIRSDEIRIGERASYARVVEAMAAEGPLPLAPLLAMDYDTFYERAGGDAVQRRANYALAWGLIYYLRKGAPLETDNRYEEILPTYEDALWRLQDAAAATAAAFAEVDLAAFNRSFASFWHSAGRRHRALRHDP